MDAQDLRDFLLTRPLLVDGSHLFKYIQGEVSLEDIGFSYDDQRKVLQKLNINVQPGSHVAIVGEPGAGKSTILNLIFRLLNTSDGKILVDGQNLLDVTLDSFHRCMGFLRQEPLVLDDSILENVRCGDLGSSDEAVIEACKFTALHDKIAALPESYRTKIGHGGLKLSRGEQQQLAIARLVVQKPKIFLLDEPLDGIHSEQERIQAALDELTAGKTTLMVTHRYVLKFKLWGNQRT